MTKRDDTPKEGGAAKLPRKRRAGRRLKGGTQKKKAPEADVQTLGQAPGSSEVSRATLLEDDGGLRPTGKLVGVSEYEGGLQPLETAETQGSLERASKEEGRPAGTPQPSMTLNLGLTDSQNPDRQSSAIPGQVDEGSEPNGPGDGFLEIPIDTTVLGATREDLPASKPSGEVGRPIADAAAVRLHSREKLREETRQRRVAFLLSQEVRRIVEDLEFHASLLLDIWSKMRLRKPLLNVLRTRYEEVSPDDLLLLPLECLDLADRFYRMVEEFRLYIQTTEDMPTTLETTYERYRLNLTQASRALLFYLDEIHAYEVGMAVLAPRCGEIMED